MKKVILTAMGVLTLSTAVVSCKDGDDLAVPTHQVDKSNLPLAATGFLKKYYNDVDVKRVNEGTLSDGTNVYNVELVDGTRIDFDDAGKWTSVDSAVKEIPLSVAPLPIADYIKQNYPTNNMYYIHKWAKGYDVKLSDNYKLSFDLNGNFVKKD